MRYVFIIITGLFALPTFADSTGAHGKWTTEVNDEGGYLEVTIGPCATEATLTCGTISKAYTSSGEDPDYENLGRSIVENMKYDGDDSYSGGKIWDPENGKTYKSKMTLKDDELDVEGCISFICEGQHWQRAGQ